MPDGPAGRRFTARVPMRWSDMDAYGHVNNVQFLTYVEEARIEMLRGLAERQPAVPGQGILVARSEIVYRLPLVHRHHPVPIDVWVTKVGGASFDLAYEVHDDGGSVVYATASSRMVPYDFGTERPRRLTAVERTFLTEYLAPGQPEQAPVR